MTTLPEFTGELVKNYIRYQQHKPEWAERHYRKRSDELVSAGAIRNYVRDLKAFAVWLAEEHYTPSMYSPVSPGLFPGACAYVVLVSSGLAPRGMGVATALPMRYNVPVSRRNV